MDITTTTSRASSDVAALRAGRPASARDHVPAGRDAGFALVVVIWITGLVALLTLPFAAAVRQHLRATAERVSLAKLEALADGGVALAADQVLEAARSRAGSEPSAPTTSICRTTGGETLAVRVSDEAGRVDLNVAGEDVLTALFAGIGRSADDARALAEAVADFRDFDDDRREYGAEATDYARAGRDVLPRNAPFETIDEIAQVHGITERDVAALAGLVTVRSAQEGVDTAVAGSRVLDVLVRGAAIVSNKPLPVADSLAQRVPASFRVATSRQAFGVRAVAISPGGAAFVRTSVITIAAAGVRAPPVLPLNADEPGVVKARRPPAARAEEKPLGAKLWDWRRGVPEAEDFASARAASPPCTK